MAASSAAFNIEVFAYDVLNSFSQACTTFVGQNYGAGKLDRCKRILTVFTAYTFSMLYEVMSGYLRGFGISLTPAILTTIGVCGVRIGWIHFMFPQNQTFQTILIAYPLSLATTALMIFVALLCYRPSRRFAALQKSES